MDIDALDKQVRSLMAFRQWAEPILAALIPTDQPALPLAEEPVDTNEAPADGGEAAPEDVAQDEQQAEADPALVPSEAPGEVEAAPADAVIAGQPEPPAP